MVTHANVSDPSGYVGLLWVAWVVIWIIAARRVKKVRAHEAASTRMAYLLPKILTALLLFSPIFRRGFLSERFIGFSPAAQWTGVALTALGILFTIWARVHIGRNWSARVVIKEQHELIRTVPYRFVRHPIYTGLLVAVGGTDLVSGEWRGLFALAFAIFGSPGRRRGKRLSCPASSAKPTRAIGMRPESCCQDCAACLGNKPGDCECCRGCQSPDERCLHRAAQRARARVVSLDVAEDRERDQGDRYR